MSIHELKEQLHQKIDELNDEKILAAINNLISSDEALFVIPTDWKFGIQQGKEDITAGRVFTLQDFEEKYQHWLGE